MKNRRILAEAPRSRRNGIAATLADPRHRPRVMRPKAGVGSYRRKERTHRPQD